MNSAKHFEKNIILEERIDRIKDDRGHINGQMRFPVSLMHFGNARAGFASCELIAIHNVLADLGIKKRLSDIIYDAEDLGYLFAGGFFGTKISKIGKLLEKYNISYKKERVSDFVENGRTDGYPDGTIFIVTIKTRSDLPVSPLHTFEMLYYEGKWIVYNRFNNDRYPAVYNNLGHVLKNGKEIGAYYNIYRIDI